MNDVLRFTVPGEPVAKQRHRIHIRMGKSGKPFPQEYTPKGTRDFESLVRGTAQQAALLAGWTFTKADRFGLRVNVFRTYKDKGGDWDNYAKSVCDGLNGTAWADDRHVRDGAVSVQQDKAWPRTVVEVRKL